METFTNLHDCRSAPVLAEIWRSGCIAPRIINMSDKRHASTSSSQANEPSVPTGQGGWMDPELVERCRALKLVTTLKCAQLNGVKTGTPVSSLGLLLRYAFSPAVSRCLCWSVPATFLPSHCVAPMSRSDRPTPAAVWHCRCVTLVSACKGT